MLTVHVIFPAELYLTSERLEEAQACISEAGSIFPISYLVSYMVSYIIRTYVLILTKKVMIPVELRC